MKQDLIGKRFGRLTAIHPVSEVKNSRRRTYWICRCDCGSEVSVVRECLLSGSTASCGCYQREEASRRSKTHGMRRTRLYSIWTGIITRCTNENETSFHNYGGRGISICEHWRHSFANFAADVGDPPSDNHSIDRWPNNDGNYEPGNVRWATSVEQCRNRRGLVEIECNGKTVCLTEAAEMSGINYGTLYYRIVKHKWPPELALSVPAKKGQKVHKKEALNG